MLKIRHLSLHKHMLIRYEPNYMFVGLKHTGPLSKGQKFQPESWADISDYKIERIPPSN